MSPLQEIIHLKSTEGWLSSTELSKEAEPLFEEYLNVLIGSPLFLQALGKCFKKSYWSPLARGIVMYGQIYFESDKFGYSLVEYRRIEEEGRSENTLSIKRDTLGGDKGEETPQEIVEIKLESIEGGAMRGAKKEVAPKVLYYKYRFPGDHEPPRVFSMNSRATIEQAKEFLQRMKEDLSSPQTK